MTGQLNFLETDINGTYFVKQEQSKIVQYAVILGGTNGKYVHGNERNLQEV